MRHTIFYDGVCGLCNRLNRFVLKRDRRDLFRFAALQSAYAKKTLAAHGKDPDDLDTMIVVSAAGELFVKARAALFVLRELGGGWRLLALLRFLPRFLLDWAYDRIARNRYRLFGRYDACPIPSAQERATLVSVVSACCAAVPDHVPAPVFASSVAPDSSRYVMVSDRPVVASV
jgi:predicted DCC family thiol-disulfide oxidoreductase YuxK